MRRPEVGNDYLIEIDRIRGADHLALNVETEHHFSPVLAQQIDDELYNLLGLHAEVILLPLGGLPRPTGKAVRVKDKRDHGQ